MSRTTEQVLDQLHKLLPAYYQTADALLGGFAAAQAHAESSAEDLRALATFGNSSGMWLTLHAHGYGIRRAANESDASLRGRLRRVQDQVTWSAIETAVNAIIAPDTCRVVEWFEGPFLGIDTWLNNQSCIMSGGPSSFLVIIPSQGTTFDFGSYLNADLYLGIDSYIGDGPEAPAYAAIVNEVNRIKAAGVFWRLVLES